MFNPQAEARLCKVHPDLQRVIRRALVLSKQDFTVTEGLRTLARQKQLVAAGASKTMNSRHLTGHAVDLAVLVGGKARWDWPLYTALSNVVKQAADECEVSIVWGGDWINFKDGPHYELDRKVYP
jgi:peptidoglycan L-alanyl-D-glutamate endopeptidase CwlK